MIKKSTIPLYSHVMTINFNKSSHHLQFNGNLRLFQIGLYKQKGHTFYLSYALLNYLFTHHYSCTSGEKE